ncbi:hypothetical protein IQ238_24580 [Pleurocapsales cyanobacterium LEGE 06147]|nr:hypothetical protein [Pleurocapsales cyanobacterium LEGE 06147]
MKRVNKIITITHRQTGELIARGPQGWCFMPFEADGVTTLLKAFQLRLSAALTPTKIGSC